MSEPEYLIIKGFVDKDYATSWAKSAMDNLVDHPFDGWNGFITGNGRNIDPENKVQEVRDYGQKYFNEKYASPGKKVVFDRSHGNAMSVGAYLVSHKDMYNPEDIEHSPGNALVCNLFLNDDYDGGELIFPDQGLSLKPEPGDLVIFPGFLMTHGVNKVTRGTRLNIINHFMLQDEHGNLV